MSFDARLNEMRETHALKGRDYGTDEDEYLNYRSSEEAGIPAWFNAALRVREKLTRVMTFYRKGELANESVEDALRDIATGGAIAWDLYLESLQVVQKIRCLKHPEGCPPVDPSRLPFSGEDD